MRHAYEMAIVASGLTKWDVKIEPKTHSEASRFEAIERIL
jgi:hypothetical protein